MTDRNKILGYFRGSNDGDLTARLLDLADDVRRGRQYRISGFLDPHEQNVAEIVAVNCGGVRTESDGGFNVAERVKFAFVRQDFPGVIDYEIRFLYLKWDKRYCDVSHRDVLGAFTGLGCSRDRLGDIVFANDGAQIAVERELAEFLLTEFKSVGTTTVDVEEIDRSQLYQRQEKIKVISATVADLRLDAIAAAGYGISRSRMAEEIKSQNVKINWQTARKPSQAVVEGDTISFRSKGRVQIAEVRGLTKKGRTSVILNRFI